MKLRKATLEDLPIIIGFFADDILGQTREDASLPLNPSYIKAFETIEKDANQELLVLVNEEDEVLGTLQLSYLQYLNRKGSLRALIESVHVKSGHRGEGLGEKMMRLAIAKAKNHGATVIQLTSDKSRSEAHRFYNKLGFIASHEGFKLIL